MAKMIALDPAIRVELKDDWALVASEAGRYAEGLQATIALWRNGTMVPPAESFPLADGTTRQAFAALVVHRIRGYAQDAVEGKLLELFAAIEGHLRASKPHGTYGLGPSDDGTNGTMLPYSDYTNALALVRDHGATLRYCYPWKSWLVWTGTHWERDTSGRVMTAAKQTITRLAQQVAHLGEEEGAALAKHVKASLATVKLKAMIECAQSEDGIPVQPEALDADPWLLNCANGTLDLRTGTLQPHQQADLITRCLAVPYEPQSPCPTWERFLWRIMGGSGPWSSPDETAAALEAADERAQRLTAFLQRATGYALTGDTREQCLFIGWGSGANGKSTFLEALQALLGTYAQSTPSATLLTKDRHDGIPNDIARLKGARLVTAVEVGESKRLNEELVKRLTGQDTLTARFLFAEFFDFRAEFKVFLACNDLPIIRGTDHATWRRIQLIPFTVTIPDDEQDKDLPATLQEELPGILAWAVRGCLAWQHEGLGMPEEVSTATQDYRQEMDVLARFLGECCVLLPEARVRASQLYQTYQRWCEATGERWVFSAQELGKRLTTHGYQRYTNNGTWYRGIGIAENWEQS